jgi:hypothetical protein
MSLQTPDDSVQKLQTSLQAKAKAEPAFRFYALWDKVWRADVIEEAYRRCRANDGAPGVDDVTFDKIEAQGRKQWLEGLIQELRDGSYRPQSLLRVWIPKSNGGCCRPARRSGFRIPQFLVFPVTDSHAPENSNRFAKVYFLRGLPAMQGAFVVRLAGGAD